MKNKNPSKSNQSKKTVLILIIATILLISSFTMLYIYAKSPNPLLSMECEGGSESISPSGHVIINEADVGCLNEAYKIRTSRSQIDTTLKTSAAISSVLTLYLLSRLYKNTNSQKKS